MAATVRQLAHSCLVWSWAADRSEQLASRAGAAPAAPLAGPSPGPAKAGTPKPAVSAAVVSVTAARWRACLDMGGSPWVVVVEAGRSDVDDLQGGAPRTGR